MLQSGTAPNPEDGLAGLIERVTFHDEETGFAVLRVKVKGRRELATVVGSLASVSAGEWITAQGRWVRDSEHGLQLNATFLECTPPTSREGIEKYLGSGMIKGIGPVNAKKMVDRFGEEIFTIITDCSARLEEIDGIGKERRRRIKEAWKEQKAIREIMVFLHSNGVSTSRAVRIFKTYGEQAIETVRANPYTLAKDISGIGFKTADQIAEKVGIPKDSIIRACAGISHCLLEATNSGHCALPKEMLAEQAKALLAVDEALIREALDRLLVNREVVEEQIGEHALIFLPALRATEVGIAAKIRAMASQPATHPVMDIEKAIEWCEKKTGRELAASQKEAIKVASKSRVLIITGGPGVGKTTLINSLLLIFRAKKIKCLLCAPTGRAAKRLADFEEDIDRNPQSVEAYARLIAAFARKESLHPFEASAVARVIDHSSRLAADAGKLSIGMQAITDLLREADYFAGSCDHCVEGGADVQSAIDAKERRASRLRGRFQEEVRERTILIDTTGEKVGQVNAVSVVELGGFAFGQPNRITSRARLGSGKVIDIEREVKLSGPIHSKGVLILSRVDW